VGVSPATITAMEDGQNKNYHVVARALGVEPEFFIRKNGWMLTNKEIESI
jgi:hypothetical protein